MTRDRSAAVLCLLTALLAAGCAGVPAPAGPGRAASAFTGEELTPSQQYAGEVLAYLMRVVLGFAGPDDLRAQWASRGLDVPLDFKRISSIMLEPKNNRAQVVVFDTRILGISEVLYHYDPGLNLFKGTEGRQSLFPSVELIALRLLLLQKMHRGETVRLEEILVRKGLLLDSRLPVTAQDLSATGLSRSEMSLLRAAISSDAHLFRYLVYPPMVRALYEVGAVERDPFVDACLDRFSASGRACRFSPAKSERRQVRIALLPSIIRHFEPEGDPTGTRPPDFRPDEFYERLSETLKRKIRDRAGAKTPSASDFLLFSETPSRPQVIYPENGEAEFRRLCPKADFAVVLVGKDVLQSFDLSLPGAPLVGESLLYLDIMDIERSLIETELDIVEQLIASRLN